MPDREKVLKALEHHKETAVCNGCPYAGDDDTPQGNCPVYDDAIALLKEQEPQETAKPDFWISVEERLPNDSVEVFVLLKIKDVLVPDMGALICGNWWSTLSYNAMVGDPLFWANIPHGPDGYKWYTDVKVNGDVHRRLGGENGG